MDAPIRVDPEDEHLLVGHSIVTMRGGHQYVRLHGNGTQLLHRRVMGDPVGLDVDHLNGDTLDNRKVNLRVVTRAVNCQNSDAWGNGICGYRGVVRHVSGRFNARIKHNGRTISLGYHATPELANNARLRKEKELWGIQPRRLPAFQKAGLA